MPSEQVERSAEKGAGSDGADAPSEQAASVYRQCASCGAPIEVRPTLAHSNGPGALWSDGYRETRDAAEPTLLGRCRVCGAIGCLLDLVEMESAPELALKGDYTFVPLTLSDYASLLESVEDIAEQFHPYLRIKYWQLSNHRRRGTDGAEPLTDVERANMVDLLGILGDEEPHRLVKAEIHRQLEQFEQAESLLTESAAPELASMTERLRRLLAERNAGIVQLFTGAPGDEIPEFVRRTEST